MFEYAAKGTCSRNIQFAIEDGKIASVAFDGGCRGNTQAMARLLEGMPAGEAVKKLSGIVCGARGTSCADQLAQALAVVLGGSADQS